MNLFAERRTCMERNKDCYEAYCDNCINNGECTDCMYFESDVLEAIKELKKRIREDMDGLKSNDSFDKESDYVKGKMIAYSYCLDYIDEFFGVQESQSLTGGGSPIHKVEGTLSAHEVGEAQQTAIPYCKRHQCFHKVFPKYKSCEGK